MPTSPQNNKLLLKFIWCLSLSSLVFISAANCGGSSGRGGGGSGGGEGVADDGSVELPDVSAETDEIVSEALKGDEVFTNKTTESNCQVVTFVTKLKGKIQPGVIVNFSLLAEDVKFTERGAVTPEKSASDKDGRASTSYCSGNQTGALSVVGKVGDLSANSAKIKIIEKATITLRYSHTDLDLENGKAPPAGDAEGDKENSIVLNLIDSGPNDCTSIHFKLLSNKEPIVGKNVQFRTQLDYPKGAKLAKKGGVGATAIDAKTSKKYAVVEVTSSGDGTVSVPICAGTTLGTILVSGTYTVGTLEVVAHTPVIRITAGLTNHANMSLTFDPKNAKTLRGYFNTNSEVKHPITVKLGAMQDGDPVNDFPVSVYSETGKIEIENGGIPNDESGTTKFTIQALHMGTYRPHPKYTKDVAGDDTYTIDTLTTCDPIGLVGIGENTTYQRLAKNWRSTVIYSIRGQEHFFDRNSNGLYDVGGDGFWDKNQNGIYDAGDVITLDVNNNGNVDGEWFIDLPSPFVDVDEDGKFDGPGGEGEDDVDILIGDEYRPPNGKRDADTLIWRYEYVPIYMGTSPYAMLHSMVHDSGLNSYDESNGAMKYFEFMKDKGLLATSIYNELEIFNLGAGDNEFYGVAASAFSPTGTRGAQGAELANNVTRAGFADVWRYATAHGVCGNPVPGGTEITANVEARSGGTYGDRAITTHFYSQPGDSILEPSRRLLKSAGGASTAVVNFNNLDHPSSQYSYPVMFEVGVAACTNSCTGNAVETEGVACDGKTVAVNLNIDGDFITRIFSIAPVTTCTCVSGSSYGAGVCTEPEA